jgi:hypothetical protein
LVPNRAIPVREWRIAPGQPTPDLFNSFCPAIAGKIIAAAKVFYHADYMVYFPLSSQVSNGKILVCSAGLIYDLIAAVRLQNDCR